MGINPKNMIDKKALKILHDTYWSSTGWRKDRHITPEDFAYAQEKGLMFDPVSLSHNEIVNLVLASWSKVTHAKVTNGFLASLSSRRLDWRSALGSFAVARHFPKHKYTGKITCSICGEFQNRSHPIDLSRLSFERFKWGGVNHWNPTYIGFDLSRFAVAEVPNPSVDDLTIMTEIIRTANGFPDESRPADLEKSLSSVLKSNRAERRVLIQILGYCGILQPVGMKSFYHEFVKYYDRKDRPVYKIDWAYPVSWWRGKHNVNEKALKYYFPRVWKMVFSG